MNKKLILVGAMLVSGFSFAQHDKETAIDEVTIATKMPQKFYKNGKNITLLTQQDLEKYEGQSLSEVLDRVAGVQITGNFNNAQEPKTMRIRGGKMANIMILLDGVPLKDVSGNDYTAADIRLLPLENVESIEALNGASSVIYGSNATVSVINIKTKKTAVSPLGGEIGMRGGSFETYSQNAAFRGSKNGFNYQISGFNEKSEGLSSAEGDDTFDKDGFEKQNLTAGIGYSSNKFGVNVNSGWSHHLFQFDYGAFTDGKQRGNDRQYFVGGQAWWQYSDKGKLTLNTRYTNSRRLSQELAAANYEDQYLYLGNNFFTEIFTTNKISDFLDFVGGAQYEKQSMAYQQKPWDKPALEDVLKWDDTNITQIDIFANANFHYSDFHLDAGARMTNHSKFKEHFVYSVNPYYLTEFGNHYFKAGYSLSTAFIAPTLYQNFGSLPYVLPNFDLKPETNLSHEIDLSFGKTDRSLVINAAVFQREEKNIFKYESLPNFTGHFVNVDRNKVKGAELGVEFSPVEMLKFGANYSFVEKDNAETRLRQPKHRVNSFLEIMPWKSTAMTLTHQFVSSRSDDFWDTNFVQHNVILPDYNLFNLNLNQKIRTNLDFYLNIGNLFNKSYTDVVGFTTKPRNYTFGMSYKF